MQQLPREQPRHCVITERVVQDQITPDRPLGTIGEIMVRLACQEDTAMTDKTAIQQAPISALPLIEPLFRSHQVALFTLDNGGYGGALVAVNGQILGPLQPTARPDLQFSYGTNSDSAGSRIALIGKRWGGPCEFNRCDYNYVFSALDMPQFNLAVAFSATARSVGRQGPRTSTPYWRFFASGTNLLNQRSGDDLIFTERDSKGMSEFLLMRTFPNVFTVGRAKVVCRTQANCIFTVR